MNTLKKLFSVSAIVALLGTLAPMYAFGATYTDEQVEAYEYAHSKGITTMETIEKANMEGNLTRIAMAKMIANYATAVLGLEPDTSAKCTFSDVPAALDAQYDNGVTNACQLGLMGQNITAFRPNDPVTRGEFGTTLSRALNANDPAKLAEMNKANPFYEAHLNFLKEEGIMNNISNPNMNERRGWVMIMMMRADAEYTEASEGCSMNELLACFGSDDVAACMAACNGEEEPEEDEPLVVKAGTLNVSATANDGAKIFLGGVSELDTINLKASEDINVEKITLEKYGYTQNTGIKVWLENEDGVVISNEKTLTTSKDEVTLTIKKDYRNAKENKAYSIVVDVDTGHAVGDTLGFKVTDVISSAETLKIASYTPATYSMVTYTSSSVTAELKGKDTTYNYEAGVKYQVSKFRVKAGNAEISVKGFTLTETGTSNLDLDKYVDSVTVLAGESTLKLSTSDVNKDGTIKVAFPEQVVAAKKYVDFTVYVTLADDFEDFGKFIKLDIDSFNATETKTSARVVPAVTYPTAGIPAYTFQGTKIKVTNTNLGKVSAPWGAEDVVVAEGTLELAEAIELNDFVIETNNTGVESLELWLNGSLVAEGELNTAKTGFTFKDALLDKAGKLQFVADFLDSTEANTSNTSVTLSPTFNRALLSSITTGSVGKYDNSNEKVEVENFAGSISFSTITIESPKGALENTLTQKVEVLTDGNAKRVTLFDGTYTAKKGDVYLNSGAINGSAALDTDESVTFYITIGSTDLDVTLESGEQNEDLLFSDVLVKNGESVSVKVEAEVIAQTASPLVYTLVLEGEDADTNTVNPISENMVTIDRVSAGSVNVVATLANDVVLRQNNISLAKFTVKPELENTRLNNFVLTGLTNGTTALTSGDLKVTVDGTLLDASEGEYSVSSTGTLLATGLDVAMDSDGVVVEVIFKTPADDGTNDGEYAISLTSVNENGVTKSFNKYIVPVLVKVTAQDNLGDSTRYTFSVQKAKQSYDVTDFTMNGINLGTITNGQTEELANGTSMAFITGVVYNSSINISKDNYKDYFRLGDSFLKIFKAKDE